jgi:RNA polymerase sigma-70 factor (ECF subfamily)
LNEHEKLARFEQEVLPHLDAAYNLARWLTGDEHDANDVVQESCLRAFKFFAGFRGGNVRAWLLTVVRNTGYTWLKQNRNREIASDLEEEAKTLEDTTVNPETIMIRNANVAAVRQAMEHLQVEFREAIILREMEGLSYKEIADVAGVPIGTVMSRLARGRKHLQQLLSQPTPTGGIK